MVSQISSINSSTILFLKKILCQICNLEAPTETEPVTEDLDQVGILGVPFCRCHLRGDGGDVIVDGLEIPQAPVEQ